MQSKGFLLASAAGAASVAFAPVAGAADLPTPMKAPPYIEPPASWAGWYIGLNAGGVWHQAHNDTADAGQTTANATGFIGGGQIGYNWQKGNLVVGVEADGSWLSAKAKNITNFGFGYNSGMSSKIDWLATARLRMGLAVGDTMVYTTAGAAFAGVKSTAFYDVGPLGAKSESKTRVGWTVGGGVEHMWTRNWTIGLEGLFVDLASGSRLTHPRNTAKTTKFSNQAVIGRFKLNYKF